MDQRELHLQPVGICYRLYHFIMKILASQASKTVTLGRPLLFGSTQVPTSSAGSKEDKVVRPAIHGLSGDSVSSPTEKAEEKKNPCMNIDEIAGENTPILESSHQGKAPKKMVSINNNVEEIYPSNKKKRSKSFQKSNSLEQEEEEVKHLRSILKVSSNLNEKSNS